MENSSSTTIATSAQACVIRFNAAVHQAKIGQTRLAFEDQLARFNIWAANIGVFAEAHASLDYRVRNSKKAKAMMLQLLQALQRKLQFALEIVHRFQETDLDDTTVDDTGSESSQSETSKTSTNSTELSSASTSRGPPSSLTKCIKDIEAAINRLHRLTLSIRQSNIHNRSLTAPKFALVDENGNDIGEQFENFALRLVQAKFPAANLILRNRLAHLIFQRRKMFSYQQRHQQKLAKGTYPTVQPSSKFYPGMQPAQSSQSSQSSPRSGSSNPTALLKERKIDKALSTTTVSALATTNILSRPASLVSSSASSSNPDTTVISFPSPPKLVRNAKEFQCPYCGLLLGVKDNKPRQWRKHVIHDLEPYICMFEQCNMEEKSFRRIDDWVGHMKQEHTLQWYCGMPGCQNQEFDEQTLFQSHLEHLHPGTYSASQLPILIESMRRPRAELFERCPLCDYVPDIPVTPIGNLKAPVQANKSNSLSRHIAAHLEGLALFSLPWQDDVDEISSSRNTQSQRKRSSFRDSIFGCLENISLNFDDPPNRELLEDWPEQRENNYLFAETGLKQNEWEFVPSMPYAGHSQDRVLQALIRKYLSSQVDNPGSEQNIQSEVGLQSTQVELQAICDWISSMDFAAMHDHVLATFQEGTCEWFLQSPLFTDFIRHTGGVIWARGIRMQLSHIPFQSLLMINSWIGKNRPLIPNDVQAVYDLHKDTKAGPSMTQCMKMLAAVVPGCESVFVVIDALDECSPHTRQELVEKLRLVQPSIRLLITSRYLGDIKEKLGNVPTVEVLAPEEDLKRYSQSCIESYPDLRTHFGDLPYEAKEEYFRKMSQSAAGMFPLIKLLTQSLSNHPRRFGAGPPPLSHISHEIDTFYNKTITRIFNQSSSDANLARLVLMWMAFSRRPLTILEITHAIGVGTLSNATKSQQVWQVEPFTAACAGVLTIDSDAGTLHLAHVTFREYLQRNQEVLFAQPQEHITTICVKQLLLEEFKAGPCLHDQSMLVRLQEHPFFHYAASEWGYHAVGAAEKACKEVIIDFLENKLAVESAMQAKNIPLDWRFYPQSIDSSEYPHGVPGIALAALFNLATIVESMLDNNGNETNRSEDKEALFWAATGGSAEVLRLLLERGVNPNVPGAMRAAAENGHEHIIRMLISNGGDIDARGHENDGNALQAAAIKGNEPLIKFLLKHGANPSLEGGELGSVLHIAAVNGDESITRLLLDNGADPNTRGGMYGFALQAAVEEGHEKIIKMLLDAGADVNLEGGPYGNAFQAAAENGDRDIVELLLAHGANIDTMIGGEKYTALQEVARRGSEDMVELLIEKGVNISSRQRNGQTALHQAAKEGHAGVVALLLKKGANHNTRDQRGFTALDWARKKKFSNVVTILEAAT